MPVRAYQRLWYAAIFIGIATIQLAAAGDAKTPAAVPYRTGVDDAGPTTVRIARHSGRYSLTVDDKPYAIKGAGMGYSDGESIAGFAAAGGNTFRTWDTQHLNAQLDSAHKYSLMILVGLETGKELNGFNYDDAAAVSAQYTAMTRIIDRYRNHPNVLGWIIANEPNLLFDGAGAPAAANPRVYDALGDLVRYIHANDPSHPVTISFAFTPTLAVDIATALKRIPSLDFVSFQAYGALPAIPGLVKDLALDRPFMVTEFGPLGHWEMPVTQWGREIEEPSGPKATGYVQRMQPVIIDDRTGKLIGAFAFLWGQKQERTPTWYGMFSATGQKTAIVDELTRLWTGAYPANRAPLTQSITLDKRPPGASIRVLAGTSVNARVTSIDPDGDRLTTRWELMEEVRARSAGGHHEATPDIVPLQGVPGEVSRQKGSSHEAEDIATLKFVVPARPGEYRLFAYSSDRHNAVGTANIPFLVETD
jgi:hypothetical protein